MKLTQRQLNFYDTFGFLKFPGLFAKEIDDITEAFENVWGATGHAHDHQQRSMMTRFVDRNEYLSALIDDPRIGDVCSSVLGADYNYAGSDGNYYVGDTNWHSDHLPHERYRSFKMAFYLDRVTAETGCLRVIPGSCHDGDRFTAALHDVVPLTRNNRNKEVWGVHGSEVPAVALECQPGDLLMFNHKLKHSSWGGDDRRRMFTLNFSERFSEELLPRLREMVGRVTDDGQVKPYGDAMLGAAGADRMRHLEQWLEVARELNAQKP